MKADMKAEKIKKLNTHGWQVGNAKDFLGLSDEEIAYIELKASLGKNLKARRKQKSLTQVELAKILKSDQARIARMESGDPSVSIDLLIKSLFSLGTTTADLAKIISSPSQSQPT